MKKIILILTILYCNNLIAQKFTTNKIFENNPKKRDVVIDIEKTIISLNKKLEKAKDDKAKNKIQKYIDAKTADLNKFSHTIINEGKYKTKILSNSYFEVQSNFIQKYMSNHTSNGYGLNLSFGYKYHKHFSFESGMGTNFFSNNSNRMLIIDNFYSTNTTLYDYTKKGNSTSLTSIFIGNSYYYLRAKSSIEVKLKLNVFLLSQQNNDLFFRKINNSNYTEVIQINSLKKNFLSPSFQIKYNPSISKYIIPSLYLELGTLLTNNFTNEIVETNMLDEKKKFRIFYSI